LKFKRIEIHGFKSFADKHEIPFGNGVTAIVGPNGCGKSNVADSVRWVLGEQSAKLLRGTSMQDVIFNGTEKRKSISYCEVALVFDNRDKLFPSLEYDEVVLSRKLYRSGESEYALNRTPCRLKDITELLREGGMGREGYSIIGQGRIEQLLSAKPEDRRAIFEEAAGISKFKAKKLESERKLARTAESLVRINDILEEKAKQLEPLTRQAENARKWLSMRDRLKTHEINTYIYQYETASEAKAVINERLTGVTEALDYKNKSHEAAGASYNESMYNLNSIGRTIDTLREELLELTVGMEKQAGDMKVLKERLNNLFEQNRRAAEENARLNAEYEEALGLIEAGTKRLEKKRAELDAVRAEAEAVREAYLSVSQKLSEGEGTAQSNQAALLEAMDRLADIKANMSRLTAEREALNLTLADLGRRKGFIEASNTEDAAEYDSLSGRLKGLTEEKTAAAEGLKALYGQNNGLRAQLADTTEKIERLNETYFTAASRRKMLAEMQQAFEGFAFSIRNLMNDAQKDQNLKTRMEGVVAQVISVGKDFETAIETALGPAMQNVITKTEDDAKYIIEYLKRKQYGRVTFLPLSSFKPRSLDRGFLPLLKTDGCLGIAGELVECDPKYRRIVDGLLGGTVIARDMTAAIALAKKAGYGFRIVTLEGEIINPSGAITGGGRKNDIANIFSHDRELKELNDKVGGLSAELKELTAKKTADGAALEKVVAEIERLSARAQGVAVELASLSERHSKLSQSLQSAAAQLLELDAEAKRAADRVAAIDADLNSVTELENTISEKKQLAKLSDEAFSKVSDALKRERDTLAEQLSNVRVTAANLENTVSALDGEIRRAKEDVAACLSRVEENNRLIDENNRQIAEIDESVRADSDKKTTGEGDFKRVQEIREKLDGLDTYREELQEKIAALDNTRQQLFNEIQTLTEKKSREEMLLQKVDFDIEQFEIHIREDYELEYEDCLAFKEADYNAAEGTAEIAKLKRSMSALGNVNLDAIELSQQIFAEYNDMDIQKSDLERAEADLQKIIRELADEMLTQFNGAFEQIRRNFIKTFKELFNGGNADLILLENENPLEAGIEIVAQPPEKKLLSISLLSGGERALTAIAILFSILKLKPMPFCLLDEIEAALDDANANRFAKYLRRFSEETQFIVITHRKPTMELADSLYGVTMEEKGVSKIVSVKLSEATNMAEKTA
jgi:chromosome segregation protein